MRPPFRLLLLSLVALWLPVTLHCQLEAAGFFAPHDDCATELAAGPCSDCRDDNCATVEDTLYKEPSLGLLVAASTACNFLACFALVTPDSATEFALSPARHSPPPELKVGWQFSTRAAPPARAPTLNV